MRYTLASLVTLHTTHHAVQLHFLVHLDVVCTVIAHSLSDALCIGSALPRSVCIDAC